MRRLRLAGLIVVLASVLAGCSEIPMTGPVQVGATEEPNGTSLVYVANPPAAGAGSQEIVTGFLAAMSAGGDFHVAKQYLTAGFAARWKPRDGVSVQEAQAKVVRSTTAAVSLSVPITARVDADGVYRPGAHALPLDFRLKQVNGQLRIDQAPNGIVLGQAVFQKFYRPLALQFFDPSWSRLVPDLRWFPVSSSTSTSVPNPRSIVETLIAGPLGPVGNGVTVNALSGATVQGIAPSSAGVTTVTLTVPQRDPSADLTGRMQQQLIQTLKLPTAGSLRLVLNDRVAPPVHALVGPAPAQVAYVLAKGVFGPLSPSGSFAPDGRLGARIAEQHPLAVTISERRGLAAVQTASKQVAIVSATSTLVLDQPASPVAPSMDQQGWVYSDPTGAPDGIVATTAKRRTVGLSSALPGTSVTSMQVSPDGTRMLLLVVAPDGAPEAYVTGIRRGADGAPTGLTSARYPVDLGGSTGNGLGATWVDNASVAVLVQPLDGSADRVQVQQLGGATSPLGTIGNATSIVGTSSQADLRILQQSGDVLVFDQQLWQPEAAAAPDVSVLAVQR